MGIQHIALSFLPRSALVDQNGIPTTAYGLGILRGLVQRTGGASGLPSVTSPPLLTATGSTIADALQLTSDWNNVGTVGSGAGVAIAAALNLQPGNTIKVLNSGSSTLNIYPPSATVEIDALGAGNPYQLIAGKMRTFECWSTTVVGGITFVSWGN